VNNSDFCESGKKKIMASAYCTLGWKRRHRLLGRDNQTWKRDCLIDWRFFCADVPLLAAAEATDWPVGRFTLDAGASAVYP
jgi:hypothetical protein